MDKQLRFGSQLRAARSLKGWTQRELADLLQVSDATINRYENDLRQPDLETLLRLAEVLDISLLQLTESASLQFGPAFSGNQENALHCVNENPTALYSTFTRDLHELLMGNHGQAYYKKEPLTREDLAILRRFVELVLTTLGKIRP